VAIEERRAAMDSRAFWFHIYGSRGASLMDRLAGLDVPVNSSTIRWRVGEFMGDKKYKN